MTNAEAIEILRANYPDACHEQLREAVDAAVEALKAQDAAGDTIIRQTAIDALAEEMPTPYTLDGSHPADEGIFMAQEIYADCIQTLKELPSAQPEYKTDEWCTDCKEYDQEKHCCPRWNRVIRNTLKDAQSEQRWVPCSERLPRDSSEKIVTFTSGYVSTASFVLREKIYCGRMLVSTRENFWQVLEEDEEEGEVVAWMPLPEPYQSKAERKADG